MDTVTQITLGAAVGEAVLGDKIGNKAPMWGALLGIVPDLDVVTSPFLSDVQEIIVHRGITHSLFFCLIMSPVLGWMLSKIDNRDKVPGRQWSIMAFWVIITHIFIDLCTSYGTQIFQPFSNWSASLNSIFIIDPFYTLPLAIGVLVALFLRRGSGKRRLANYLGIGISSLYLLFGLLVKVHVNHVFEESFQKQDIEVDRYMTTPAPFSEFLWTGYAESGKTIYAGLYSIFDDDRKIEFTRIDQNSSLIERYKDQLPIRRIRWFSNGYYAVTQKPDGMYMHDLRFGRSDLWLTDRKAPFVWNYKLEFNQDSSKVVGFRHFEPTFDTRNDLVGKLVDRTFGKK